MLMPVFCVTFFTLSLTGTRFMTEPIKLSLEQQFNLRSFKDQVEMMSHEQAKEMLLYLYEHMLVKDTMYKHFLKQEWGIEPN
jgi:Phycobilisome degradation protein nblA